jgi:hypothetical protein
MKQRLLYIAGAILITLSACYKDKGNYDYVTPDAPTVKNFDSVYTAVSGDSLIITPQITLPRGRTNITVDWEISVPEQAKSLNYTGNSLRIVFGLNATRYTAMMTVSDNDIGMKYFYNFFIDGKTVFSTGTLVLSNDNGTGRLSFITPADSVQPNIYAGINGEDLGQNPMQIAFTKNMYYMNTLNNYWIICNDPLHPGVELDPNNMQKVKTLADNFFQAPTTINPQYFQSVENGTVTGIVNGQMYVGTTSTAPFSTAYGVWGTPVSGDYTLSDQLIYSFTGVTYYVGFDAVKRQFLRFFNNTYFDTQYTQMGGYFNAADLKMDLIKLIKVSDDNIYAICDSVGKKIELKFGVDFITGGTTMTEYYKRDFPGAAMITANTKWIPSPVGVIYFSSNDKVYRYNPLNEDLRALNTTFNGNEVSMLKISADGNQLYVGMNGSLYTLDVSVGKSGDIIKKIDGIPGKVVDEYIR